jgi:hypothetical protein
MSSLEALFCDVDDFCQAFEAKWQKKQLSEALKSRNRDKSLTLSEMMTILIAFHQNHPRNFQHYHLDYVCVDWREAFPRLPSDRRFVEWMPSTLISLCVHLKPCFGQCTGSGFLDGNKPIVYGTPEDDFLLTAANVNGLDSPTLNPYKDNGVVLIGGTGEDNIIGLFHVQVKHTI